MISALLLARCARVAQEAAIAAGTLIHHSFGRVRRFTYKQVHIDLVTALDGQSERLIYRRIHAAFPDHAFVGEEGTRTPSAPFCWIVDPIDGTSNFVHGLPFYCVSIAVRYRGQTVVGVVYDPVRRECFVARLRRGATLNGRRIRVSRVRTVRESLLSTGFPIAFRKQPQRFVRDFVIFQQRSHAVRRLGSSALNLAYVAAGRIDGFWEEGVHAWDVAAGHLLLEEAGGRMTTQEGRSYDPFIPHFIASNGLIHREMLRLLRRARSAR